MPPSPTASSGEPSTGRSSSDYNEKVGLLDGVPSSPLAGASPRIRRVVILLALSNVVSLCALFYIAMRPQPVPTTVVYPPQPDWFPPQVPVTKVFQSEPLFGQEPNNESIAAWNSLLPKGRGWVHVRNQTALPDMPGLNQSLPEHIALPSVYHQLHCLQYSTMRSYYDLLDRVNNPHQRRELPADPGWNKEHLNHCWDYLRQNIMCAADVTLEWHRWNEKVETGWGYEHQYDLPLGTRQQDANTRDASRNIPNALDSLSKYSHHLIPRSTLHTLQKRPGRKPIRPSAAQLVPDPLIRYPIRKRLQPIVEYRGRDRHTPDVSQALHKRERTRSNRLVAFPHCTLKRRQQCVNHHAQSDRKQHLH
ncbi:hypothetical protein K4K51_003168 [Colletotrichum sp. SAR 10_75]|nr:hypothetical protein K4K51_003168 [Colletotrichum sp. SAR 10_75]